MENRVRFAAFGTTACAAFALAASAAHAGTVTGVITGNPAAHSATVSLEFEAAAGETNQLTIFYIGSEGTNDRYGILDTTAPLAAAGACAGGGAPGVQATCLLPKPEPPSDCTRAFCIVPGIFVSANVKLGDGDDSLTANAIGLSFKAFGAEGADTLATGSGSDTVTPGPGDDVVQANGGTDIVVAEATPDGADHLDLGEGMDRATYYARTDPVSLSSNSTADDGAPGEGDNLLAVENLAAGSGDDTLRGADPPGGTIAAPSETLEGGPGSDRIDGNGGLDKILGDGTVPGPGGNDLLFGGDGGDVIDGGGGNDAIEGAAGNDIIHLDAGKDVGTGGPGNDTIYGFRGVDRALGSAGNDLLFGETGNDLLFGGPGADVLDKPSTAKGADLLNCGAGRDRARAEAGDRPRQCERLNSAGAGS